MSLLEGSLKCKFEPVDLGGPLKLCISSQLPDEAAAVPGTHFEQQGPEQELADHGPAPGFDSP